MGTKTNLYDQDFYLWTQEQAATLGAREFRVESATYLLRTVLSDDPSFGQTCEFSARKPQQATKDRVIVGPQWSRETLDVARGGV